MATEVARPAVDARSDYLAGVLFLVLGTIAFSSAGFFVRLIGYDAATVLFWRGIFSALAITGGVAWREGWKTPRAFRDMGVAGLAVACLSTASMASFIASLQFTTVANNSIIFGTGPFLIAGLAWLFIAERPSAPTLLFAAVALLGAVLVVGSSASISGPGLIGDALAFLMTVTYAIKTVIVRKQATSPMLAAGALGAALGSVCSFPFVPEVWVGWDTVWQFALFGFCQQGMGLILTTLGIARVPAAHAALLMALDLPMSPVWVWLAFGERPTTMGLIGGLVVLAAIVGHILVEGHRRRR